MASSDSIRGRYSRIQRFSTKDGPGIRDVLFLQGCSLSCSWCANPELIPVRGRQLLHYGSRCTACGRCADVCPAGGATIAEGRPVFLREICQDQGGCRGECELYCPADALELVGKSARPDEMAAELLKDRVFYESSGGGVTFSGGEPLLQAEFVEDCARRLKEEGVHTAAESCGQVPPGNLERVMEWIDLFLYDLKIMDQESHRRYTGASNRLILENLERLVAAGKDVVFRLIVLPGVNDSDKELRERFDSLSRLAPEGRVDLLLYHELGIGKYEALGRSYPFSPESWEPAGIVRKIRALLEDYGFDFRIHE